MSEKAGEFFKKALSDFAFDVASGGAICHLADCGYTVSQIMKMLDFPTPKERVRQTVWEHLEDTGYLCLEEPCGGSRKETYGYVTEYDAYGRKSFRRVTLREKAPGSVNWRERRFLEEADGRIGVFLEERCAKDGEEYSYVSCDFGLVRQRDSNRFQEGLLLLLEGQRDYVSELFLERRMVYHRLDQRMRDIIARLYEGGWYHGTGYFIRSEEKIVF